MSQNDPYIFNTNVLTPNAIALKSTSCSLPRRLGAAAFYTLLKNHPNAKIFSISLYEIDCRLRDLGANPQGNHTTTLPKNRYSDGLSGTARINQQLFNPVNLSTNLYTNPSTTPPLKNSSASRQA